MRSHDSVIVKGARPSATQCGVRARTFLRTTTTSGTPTKTTILEYDLDTYCNIAIPWYSSRYSLGPLGPAGLLVGGWLSLAVGGTPMTADDRPSADYRSRSRDNTPGSTSRHPVLRYTALADRPLQTTPVAYRSQMDAVLGIQQQQAEQELLAPATRAREREGAV